MSYQTHEHRSYQHVVLAVVTPAASASAMSEEALGVLDDYEIAIRSGYTAVEDFLRQNTGAVCAALVTAAQVMKGRSDMLRVALTLREILWNAPRSVIRAAIRGIAHGERDSTAPQFVNPLVRIAVERVSDAELSAAAADSLATILGSCELDVDDVIITRIQHIANEQTRTLVDSLITEVALTSSPRALAALGALLRRDYCRTTFCGRDGVSTLAATLATDSNNHNRFGSRELIHSGRSSASDEADASVNSVASTYNASFATWMLSFSSTSQCTDLVLSCAISAGLTLVLSALLDHTNGRRLKVARVVLATLRNMSSGETKLHVRIRREMIGADLVTVLRRLRNLGTILAVDVDAADDAAFLETKLAKDQGEMSTLDMYLGELRAGALRWSPVHTDESFWTANAERLVTEKRDVLQLLSDVICMKSCVAEESRAVACNDLSQIVRYSINGRSNAMEMPKLKSSLMMLMTTAEDTELRRLALTCVSMLLQTTRRRPDRS